MLDIGPCTIPPRAAFGGAPQRHRRVTQALHCCIVAEARYLAQAQPAGLMRALRQQGMGVALLDPGEDVLDVADASWLDGIDIVVARGRSTDVLARLGAAEAAGVPTVNSRCDISAVVDKAHMATRLHAARIPVPTTWIATLQQLRLKIPATAFPLILKPVFGDNCRGIQVVDTPAQLAALEATEATVIAQRFVPNSGFDTKLYAIGQQVWAVRKPSPLHAAAAGPPMLLPLRPAWRQLALRCGAVFGLQLFGVDCIERCGELQVIEVNDFPNYSGVPGADELLARHIENEARKREGTTP